MGQQMAPPVPKISLPDPAYIGMPIWMQIISPTGFKVRYPSSTTPNDFYCDQIEVKQAGLLLPPLIGFPAGGRAGAACGWLGIADIAESKLPIHLQYALTKPGTYMVRFTRQEYRSGKPGMQIAEQSDWVPMHVQAAPPKMLERWLTDALTAIPKTPGQMLGDALPSLLASRDRRVLRLMVNTSYNSDPTVAAYAANSLELFDPVEVRTELLSALRQRGPNEALGYMIGSSGNIVLPIAPQIVAASLPYLRSPAPAELAGAVHVLSTLRDPYFRLSTQTTAQISDALQADVDFVISQNNDRAAWWIAQLLGTTGTAGARDLLWKLIDAGLATEQSLSCITWLHDPSDLPRLSQIVKQNDPADPHGYKHSGVVGQMQTQYGNVARPYLRDILASSPQTWVRTAAAQVLVQMNDRAGWAFFIGVVEQRPFYRDEMVRWLGGQFPEIQNAVDPEIIRFLESKLASATGQE